MTDKQPENRRSKTERTDFFQNVYEVVKLIPIGRATSYGAIAAFLGSKQSARMVGWAMGHSTNEVGIPAHRVVNAKGILTAKLQFETISTMQELLAEEGIVVINDQIQHWETIFWDPEKELI